MPQNNPRYLLPGEDLRSFRARFQDAPMSMDPDNGDEHTHIHLHLDDPAYLHPSVQNANPPRGQGSGSPMRVTSDQPGMRRRMRGSRDQTMSPGMGTGATRTSTPTSQQFSQDEDEFEPGEQPDGGNEVSQEEYDPDMNGEGQSEQILGELPPPPEGMTYRLDQDPSTGACSVVLCQDDGQDQLQDVNQGDNRRQMSDAKTRRVLRAMNRAARSHYRTGDAAATEYTIFTHTPAEGERMEIRTDRFGKQVVVLISQSSNVIGEIPEGAEGDEYGDRPGASDEDEDERQGSGGPRTGLITRGGSTTAAGDRRFRRTRDSRTGDGSGGYLSRVSIRDLNQLHKKVWSTRPR